MAKQSNTAPRNDTFLPEPAWPADNVERWPLDRLIPYARNARTHSDAQIAQIAASIREWGWTNAVLVDETGGILAGHGRVLAARQLGINEAPVTVARGWTEAKKRAYVIADNKLAMNAGWDDELLRVELRDLKFEGFDVGMIGFDPEELDTLLNAADSAADADESAVQDDVRRWLLLLEFPGEAELAEAYEDLRQRGFSVKIMD